jgi:hypothetical protein
VAERLLLWDIGIHGLIALLVTVVVCVVAVRGSVRLALAAVLRKVGAPVYRWLTQGAVMIVELCHACILAGITLLYLGFLTRGYMRAHVLCAGDVYLMARRVRARTRRVLRTIRNVPRHAWQRRHGGPSDRVALCAKDNPVPCPITRATESHGDAPRVVDSAATGNRPVVPSPRTAGDPGTAQTSATGRRAATGHTAREGIRPPVGSLGPWRCPNSGRHDGRPDRPA